MSKYFNVNNFDEKQEAVYRFIKEFPPINEKEFEAYARTFFDIKASVKKLHVYEYNEKYEKEGGCSYELKESEITYHKSALYKKWKVDLHDGIYRKLGLSILVDSAFGSLYCGGIARTYYGQTSHLSPERTEILENWWGKGITDDVKYYVREAAKRKRLKEILGGYPFRLKR